MRAEKIRELAVAVMVDNLQLWRDQLADLTGAQLAAIHEACIALADAIAELQQHRQGKDKETLQ